MTLSTGFCGRFKGFVAHLAGLRLGFALLLAQGSECTYIGQVSVRGGRTYPQAVGQFVGTRICPYNLTPAVINETVKAARDFLHSPDGEKEYKKLSVPVRKTEAKPGRATANADGRIIATFLDWKVERVEEALAEISDIAVSGRV